MKIDKGLDVLKELYLQHDKQKYPSIPDFARATPLYKDSTANNLTKSIIDFIKFNSGAAERISNTGRYLQGESYTNVLNHKVNLPGKYIPGTGTNGTADISAIIQGRAVKIEVKVGRDKQSEAQKKYEQDTIKAGGIYYIAKDFQSFYEWYNLKFGGSENV